MGHSSITLRLATLRDAQQISFMSRDLIETGLGWTWTPERVAKSIRDRDTVVLVGSALGRVAAFAIMHFGDEQAHLSLLAVRPLYQRSSVGRDMVAWLDKSLRVAGIFTVYLELRETNRGARDFYRSLGFREIGIVPGYYRGREGAVQMTRDLRTPVPRGSQPRKTG